MNLYPNSLYITLLRYTVLAFCSNLVAQHCMLPEVHLTTSIVTSFGYKSSYFRTNLQMFENKFFRIISATLLVHGASPLYKEACTMH